MRKVTVIICLFIICRSLFVFSQIPPASETGGGLIRRQDDIDKIKQLEKRIETETPAPAKFITDEVKFQDSRQKVFIKKIIIQDATLLSLKHIDKIIRQYENKELSLADLQKAAEQITQEYRKRGYVTSFAYLFPQTIKDGVLVIRIIEGKSGKVEIKGNRYSKASWLKNKIKLAPGGYFDYSALQKSLIYINKHPDRTAKAILVPGAESGTTDIVITVEDRFPIHLGAEYDNTGSRYIDKNKAAVVVEHNNFLGFDDKVYFKLQKAESNLYKFKNAVYTFPINETLEIGTYFSHSNLKLAKEFRDVDARGKADIIGLFLNKDLVTREKFNLRVNSGFDYKHIRNFLLGSEFSKDKVSVFKNGVDLDLNDFCGRTIIISEFDTGIPRMFGALASKDSNSSRSGSGGKFFKGGFNVFRLQPMPFSSTLLLKNLAQYTNYGLVASEQFQSGGAASVRGYPPGEYSGDKGIFSSGEWSFPSYFVPRNLNIPFTKDNLFKAMRFVVFYDWATTHLNRVLAGEEKHQTLKGYGFGARFNFRDYIFVRIEFGYPIGKTPSDGDRMRPWIQVNWKF